MFFLIIYFLVTFFNLVFEIAALVDLLSAIILIVLFLMQKHGTSRVSFVFSPIMAVWTFSTPIVGIYSILHHYPSIFKAISPLYMFRFFWRNGKEGWLLLGGTILCITGDLLSWTQINDMCHKGLYVNFTSNFNFCTHVLRFAYQYTCCYDI